MRFQRLEARKNRRTVLVPAEEYMMENPAVDAWLRPSSDDQWGSAPPGNPAAVNCTVWPTAAVARSGVQTTWPAYELPGSNANCCCRLVTAMYVPTMTSATMTSATVAVFMELL